MCQTDWILEPCPDPSEAHREAALARQANLTKPPGSLGRLEDVAVTLAGLQRREHPSADSAAIVLFAGDHGVTAQGVSAFPSAVTVEMVRNFARGGAAICALARSLDVPLTVVDAGTLAAKPVEGVVTDKCRQGTGDFTVAPAMTDGDLDFAFAAGRRAVERSGAPDVILFGETGIGNTTAAAAIAAAIIGHDPAEIAGAGTGLDNDGQRHKADVIAQALALHDLDDGSPDVSRTLSHVGGLEIAALTGAIIAAAQAGVPVLVDGFIVSVAALAAVRINPDVLPWLLFSHRSDERGHGIVLDALDAKPLLYLDMRLGEGSGAAIALPLVRNACALHNEMATFAEAAVSDGL
ncbi:MAG: nicotinate-nucleotide--dimethylbenzimidazole phosphoribosyltransferase [Hyphomicrobiaceae bacterium]